MIVNSRAYVALASVFKNTYAIAEPTKLHFSHFNNSLLNVNIEIIIGETGKSVKEICSEDNLKLRNYLDFDRKIQKPDSSRYVIFCEPMGLDLSGFHTDVYFSVSESNTKKIHFNKTIDSSVFLTEPFSITTC